MRERHAWRGVQAKDSCTAILRVPESLAGSRLQADVRRALASHGNVFDAKTEAASSHMYFHYYGMLQHQQNMLQVRSLSGSRC
jgi:hypothetical protein